MSVRLGVISDVHANLPALEAALARLESERVDAFVCLGDVVGYGPHPEQCIALLAERGISCVAGNHDLMVLGRLPVSDASQLARPAIDWTRQVLSGDAKSWLAGLPLVLRQPPAVVSTHGSLSGPDVYVRSESDAAAEIELLREDQPTASGVLVGHTHHPLAFVESSRIVRPRSNTSVPLPVERLWLLNPGAVGQSRERRPVARCLILSTATSEAAFLAFDYDHTRCARDLATAGLPGRAYHVPPRRARAWLVGVRNRARTLLGRGRTPDQPES